MNKNLMHLGNARVAAQRKQMEDITRRGVCPFCRKNFEADHKAPILRENRSWLIAKNDYPYESDSGKRVKTHLLLVYKKHVENLRGLSPDGMKDLLPMITWAEKHMKIKGGALLMRFGDMRYNGATIAHLHAHLVSGVREGKSTESIKKKLAFVKK